MIKGILDSLEGVHEAYRDLYEQGEDGKFRLKLEDAESLVDVSGLKSALDKERKRARDFEKKLSELGGVDAEEYRRLKEEAEAREREKAEKAGEWDKLKAKLAEKHQSEIETARRELDGMRKTLESHLVDAEAARAVAAARGVPDLLLPHVKSRVRVFEENGAYVVRAVDGKGEPRLKDADGNYLGIADVVAELRDSEVFGRAFEASGASGAGSKGGGGAGSVTLTREQLKDPKVYEQHREAYAEGRVRIV